MTSSTTPVLRCDDGTEIPFEWATADAAEVEWRRDRAHRPLPATPIDLSLLSDYEAGGERAWQESGLQPPASFFRRQLAGPFLYMRTTPFAPERMAAITPGYREIAKRHGNALGFWEQYCQPRIEHACRDLAHTGAGVSLRTSAGIWGYGHHQTFTSVSVLFEATTRLTALLAESVGDDSTLMAFEVTQGGDNASQAIDAEILGLAELARRTPDAGRILRSNAQDDALASLRREPGAAPFVAAFDAFIDRHGSRSQGWEIVLPTWRERPEGPLSLVRAQLESQGVSPSQLVARSEARRRAATEEALASLPADKHAEFARIVAELDGYVRVRENRAYWQMTIIGEMRGLLLRVGARLVEAGRIDRADDIFFLQCDEAEDKGRTDLRPLVIERRAEWEGWCKLTPPEFIGTPGAVTATPEPAQLRGTPASRGTVTGTARILHGPEDGARLQPGDIMVCVMTTPAWTPLFAIVSGIITETGAALSHPAITAREYGIPAVVAVKEATARIRDGQTVTIDGAAGLVSLG